MENTETGSSAPDNVLRKRNVIYFQATTVKYGEELWKSNGTESGTKVVKDIVPGPGVSGPEDIVSTAPRTTFFRAWDKNHGEELWKTDGTEKGTKLIKDINPDSPPGARCDQGECGIPKGWSHPDTVTVMGKQVFFAADDGKHGVELWKSDGTEKGTTLVKDINTVPGNSNPNDESRSQPAARRSKSCTSLARRSTSGQTMANTASSCGRATEQRGAPSSSRTSTPPLPPPPPMPARARRAASAVRGPMT